MEVPKSTETRCRDSRITKLNIHSPIPTSFSHVNCNINNSNYCLSAFWYFHGSPVKNGTALIIFINAWAWHRKSRGLCGCDQTSASTKQRVCNAPSLSRVCVHNERERSTKSRVTTPTNCIHEYLCSSTYTCILH